MYTSNIVKQNLLVKLLSAAILLAIAVILLGAYTRLTDAGLGCPDWPGCYGKIIVSDSLADGFNARKAWTEMLHRYLAGSLGLLITSISSLIIYSHIKRNFKSSSNNPSSSIALPILLLVTLFFQAALGMWTVTLKLLPTVVMGHLIGGLITLSLLVVLLLQQFTFTTDIKFTRSTKLICFFTLIIVFIQIILGGWTSSNYAALACLDFPTCNNLLIPSVDTLSAMNPFLSIGPNYEGGLLNNAMRVTIQLFHRWGALFTAVFVITTSIILILYKNRYYRNFSVFLCSVLITQITLGIINIKWALPIVIAVLHNGIAAILLISLIILNYKLNYSKLN